jgi:hypothetical protein
MTKTPKKVKKTLDFPMRNAVLSDLASKAPLAPVALDTDSEHATIMGGTIYHYSRRKIL